MRRRLAALGLALFLALPAQADRVADLREQITQAEASGAPAGEQSDLQYELGRALAALGDLDSAEPAFLRALELAEAVEGGDFERVSRALNAVAIVHATQGRNADAEADLNRLIALHQARGDESSPQVAKAKGNLAALYTRQGRLDEAEPLYEQAIAIYGRIPGHAQDMTMISYNLALLQERKGDQKKAIRTLEGIVVTVETVYGPEDPQVAISLFRVAERYRVTGNVKKADARYRRALEILGKRPGPAEIVAGCMAGLGWVAAERDERDEAEEWYRRALSVAERSMGRDNPSLVPFLQSYAGALREAGREDEARAYEDRAARLTADARAR